MLDIFTVIWGKEMVQTYLGIALPSLLQPQNIPGAKGLLHSYNFYASDEAKQMITKSELYRKLCQVIKVQWFPLQKGKWETTSNTLHQMKICAEESHYMLIMAPDNAVGNGSILNMAKLCNGEHNPILFGFPRVNDECFTLLRKLYSQGRIVSNRQLVSLGMRHIEQTTYPIEHKTIRWIVHNNTWVVRHNVPTPCILPDAKIIGIFSTNPTLNSGYDHTLPYMMVEGGYPWHLIRHSDIFFLVEKGRHLIIEGSDTDNKAWNIVKQIIGLEFFGKEEATWQEV